MPLSHHLEGTELGCLALKVFSLHHLGVTCVLDPGSVSPPDPLLSRSLLWGIHDLEPSMQAHMKL